MNLPATRTSHAHCRLLRHRRLFRAGHVPRLLLDEKGLKLRRLRRRRTQYAASDLLRRHRRHLVRRRRNHRAYLVYAYYRDHRVLRAYRRRHQPDFLRVVHLRARPQRREKCLQPRGPVWDLLWAFRSLAFQCVRIPVLRGGVRGTDPGDGRHPPDRHGHQPHPRRADRLNRNAGLYVVGRHPRRNPHRRRAVRHHRHRGYALRLSRHRPPRRVRRHDVDPLLQPAL